MTTTDLLVWLARTNLAASAAVLLVLALRGPVRRFFGAHVAYALWLLPPAAAVGATLPVVGAADWTGGLAAAGDAARDWLAASDLVRSLSALWLAGFAANAALALWRQARFADAERAGRAGPAMVGVFQPRLVAPSDFAERVSPGERRLIRAHELAHKDRRDGLANALAAVAAWVCWFNPLAHVALRALRTDQELACDATVMDAAPRARRAYAEALLRAEPLARQAVFGCHWLASEPPLATRLSTLARCPPSQLRRDLGLALLALACAASFGAAWASGARPAPSAYAEPTAVLMDFAPPPAGDIARVYRR